MNTGLTIVSGAKEEPRGREETNRQKERAVVEDAREAMDELYLREVEIKVNEFIRQTISEIDDVLLAQRDLTQEDKINFKANLMGATLRDQKDRAPVVFYLMLKHEFLRIGSALRGAAIGPEEVGMTKLEDVNNCMAEIKKLNLKPEELTHATYIKARRKFSERLHG